MRNSGASKLSVFLLGLVALSMLISPTSIAASQADTKSDKSDADDKKSNDNKSKSDDSSDKKKPDAKTAQGDDEAAAAASGRPTFSGNASWYGQPFHGRKTASGEIFNMYKPSAAHLTLPLPTRALVEDPRSGNVVIVKVNDRGPYVKTRVMDLSREAARALGTLSRGVYFIEVTVLGRDKSKKKASGASK